MSLSPYRVDRAWLDTYFDFDGHIFEHLGRDARRLARVEPRDEPVEQGCNPAAGSGAVSARTGYSNPYTFAAVAWTIFRS
jgi:hypothetical protein